MASLFSVDETGAVVYEQAGETDTADTASVSADTVEEESTDSGVMVASDTLVAALSASTPAAGSLSSSTLDFFDRLASGLPTDTVYVAFRNDTSDSYAGTIIYSDDYSVSGDTVTFRTATRIDVSRESSSYSSYIQYESENVTDESITLSQTGQILYYTDAVDGYPVLGGYREPVGSSALICVALVTALFSAAFHKIFEWRRGA